MVDPALACGWPAIWQGFAMALSIVALVVAIIGFIVAVGSIVR